LRKYYPGGAVSTDKWKTPVSSTTYFVSTDAMLFPDPLAFRPERWIDNGGERLDKYLTNFSKGTRNCVGQK
jgi:cytochrome P450